ncbi:MAG: radical SAM protein [Candidatus Marinimicrobia bacterium]|nr:radical SAM protein [Candidatus Neomarinimicrobiota bacterium]
MVNSAMKSYHGILRQTSFSKADIVRLLQPADKHEREALFSRAESVTRAFFGDGIYLRGIIEFSNYCRRNCAYCGIRAGNPAITRYRMSFDEILETAKTIKKAGIGTVVLQSGEDPENTREYIGSLHARHPGRTHIAVTLSLGEYRYDYRQWRRAGADRYLLKFESSNRELYRRLHPDCDFEERWRCLRDIRSSGYQLGSGFMVGLPGQTVSALADDLLSLAALEPDMAGIGPFIFTSAHPDERCGERQCGDGP